MTIDETRCQDKRQKDELITVEDIQLYEKHVSYIYIQMCTWWSTHAHQNEIDKRDEREREKE